MKYVVVNIGCLECGVSSNIVGVFENKEKAKLIAEKCSDKFSWRNGGENSFEVFELPEIDIVNSKYNGYDSVSK